MTFDDLIARYGKSTEIVRQTPFADAAAAIVGERSWALVTTRGWERRGATEQLTRGMLTPPRAIVFARPNPQVAAVVEQARAMLEIDVLVALGGGSVIDTAKALIALRSGESAFLRHLHERVPLPAASPEGEELRWPKLVAIPTTTGSGSEVTPFGTLWDGTRKCSVHDRRLLAAHAILDAGLCASMPRELRITTSLDALSHALESIWNRNHSPESDALAIAALRLLRAHGPDDAAALQQAALLSGLAIARTETALAHSLSYPLTAHFGVAHGLACSFTLGEVARFNAVAAPERVQLIADALECEDVGDALDEWLLSAGAGELLARDLSAAQVDAVRDELLDPKRAKNNIRECSPAAAHALVQRSLARLAVKRKGEVPMSSERLFLQRLGARILSEANDLKRTPDILAQETGLDYELVQRVLRGEADVAAAQQVVMRMAETYPIPLDELWLERDDTDEGVRVMRERDSHATARSFVRTDRGGSPVVYFEYRDTAMSRVAPFKPEWVQPLRIVADDDPDNPAVAFNNGHLLHQLTFYIGEVNVYWIADGRRHCARMNTGDSSYMAPFVPHSFTSRNAAQLGLIIAVTFSGDVHPALQSLARIDPEAAAALSGDLRDALSAFRALVTRYAAADARTPADVAAALQEQGLDAQRAEQLAEGLVLPSRDELEPLARAFGVRVCDVMLTPLENGEEVVIRHARDDVRARPYPDDARPAYFLTDLARTPHQPGLRGFDVLVPRDARGDGTLRHHLHEYVYNYGLHAVRLEWSGRAEVLEPGASAYVEPMVAHSFRAVDGDGRLAVIRVAGRLNDTVLREYATYGPGRARVNRESRQWFEGRSA